MSLRTSLVCLLHFLLALLFVVPLACAAVAERDLPPATSRNISGATAAVPCPPTNNAAGAVAGSEAKTSIEDVWMQHGGARQYYSAQYSARQQYMGGAGRIDPACSPLLPPMKAWGPPPVKKSSKARKPVPAANPCPETDKKAVGAAAGAPAGTTTPVAATGSGAAGVTAAATPAATTPAATSGVAGAAPNGQKPIPTSPLQVTAPKGDAPPAATAERPPLH